MREVCPSKLSRMVGVLGIEPTAGLDWSVRAEVLDLLAQLARERVLSDYQRDAMQRSLTGDEGFLRKRANVLIAKDLR